MFTYSVLGFSRARNREPFREKSRSVSLTWFRVLIRCARHETHGFRFLCRCCSVCSFWAGFLLREYHSSSNFYRYGSAFLLRKSGGQGEQSRRWKVLHKRSECGVSWECKRHSLFPTFASTGSAYVLLHAAVHGGWGKFISLCLFMNNTQIIYIYL